MWCVLLGALCAGQRPEEDTAGPLLGSSMVVRGSTVFFFGGLRTNGSASSDIVTLNVREGVYRALPVLGGTT